MLMLFLLALIGVIVSAVLHFSTCWGMGWQASMPYVWLLGIGVFVVWVPAVAIQGMLPRKKNGALQPFAFAPKWMRLLSGAAFAYAIINFAVFIFIMGATYAVRVNGHYELREHGRVIRQITEQQYDRYKTYEFRAFSGVLMVVYLAGMTLLASAMAYQRSQNSAGAPPGVSVGGPNPRPLWVHTVFAVILQMVGFFVGPALFILTLMRFHVPFGCCGALLWMATPWPGLALALYLLAHHFPAVCPKCGGRAFWTNKRGTPYRCADCGWIGS